MKSTVRFLVLLLVILAGSAGVTFAVAFAGTASCNTRQDVDGSSLQGQSAADFLASLGSERRRQEALSITEAVYKAANERGKPMPPRAVVLVVATGIQETNLANLSSGDRDSEGFLQQRPSQGWGTPEQVRDPYYAANQFFDRLEKRFTEDEIAQLPLKQLSISIQRPSIAAYGRWNWDRTAAELVSMVATPGADERCNASAEGWQLPLENDSYCVTDRFNTVRYLSGYGRHVHKGIDFSCNSGDPVFAVANGTVVKADYDSQYGWVVRIDHGDGIVTGYAHMRPGSIPGAIQLGQPVSRGQTLGYVGNTGMSYGAHLDFEVRDKGTRIDPDAFMLTKGVDLTP